MANAKLVRDGFTCPIPRPGDGTKIMLRPDGSMYLSWDRPPARMALDAALPWSRLGYDADITDIDDNHDGSGDLGDKIRELLSGKLDGGDIEALIRLINGYDSKLVAQDRRGRRQAHDGHVTALMRRRVAEGAQVRAQRAQQQIADLTKRFPNLANARVVG